MAKPLIPVEVIYERALVRRDDFAVTFQTFQATPFRRATEAVVAPVGQARAEWEIVDELMQRMAIRAPTFAVLSVVRKLLGAFGARLHPRPVIDMMIRMSDGGNRFGLRCFAAHPDGCPGRSGTRRR